MKKLLTIVILLLTAGGFSQQLEYKSRGRIFLQNEKLAPAEVRTLLEKQPGMLEFYNAGRTKKTIGNIFLVGGLSLLAGDVLIAANTTSEYPSALTYIGAGLTVLAVPIKMGFQKKIKKVVNDYNQQVAIAKTANTVSLIANQRGVGMRISF